MLSYLCGLMPCQDQYSHHNPHQLCLFHLLCISYQTHLAMHRRLECPNLLPLAFGPDTLHNLLVLSTAPFLMVIEHTLSGSFPLGIRY
jgi:hypothetical protein